MRAYAPEDLNVELSPTGFAGFIGDTVTFSAIVTDGFTGDTIPSVVVFGTSDAGVMSIDSLSGFARLHSRGTAQISVRVERLVSALFTRLDELGDAIPIDTLQLDVGESAQICLYLIGVDGFFIGKSPALCPNTVETFAPFNVPFREVYYAHPPSLDRRGRWSIPDNGRTDYIPFDRGSDS